ncbi:MAG: ATP-binding cassette domain-containing protein [Myxococcales bacterium]|nr:ATP-binding cassette domain-containing protein [Myxococcales bacterium]MDD9966820.1 ATP-binding cassette domain-containing protein [Myxococcales bacterium]
MNTELTQEAIIRFSGIHVAFGSNRVFEGLELSVRRDEILTILGESGCGKSVLLKVILGLVPWQQGSVNVDGHTLSPGHDSDLLAVRRKVGMVFQGGALFDSLTVFDNIAYPLRERGISDRAQLRKRAGEVLEMVGLPGIEAKMPAELSGGMRKRVALARAIAEAPKVLLYDEPTTGLDPVNVRRISELIVALRERLGVTAVVVTHDLASAFMISDRIAMVAERRIAAIGSNESLQRSSDPRVRRFLDAMPLGSTEALPGGGP